MKYSKRQLIKAQQKTNKEYLKYPTEYAEITEDRACAKAQIKCLLKNVKKKPTTIKYIGIDGCFLTIIIGVICITIIMLFL